VPLEKGGAGNARLDDVSGRGERKGRLGCIKVGRGKRERYEDIVDKNADRGN